MSIPMPTAIIVSHGQPSDPDVAEAEIVALAEQINSHLPDWTIKGATLATPGVLEAALETTSDGTLVYPMFMADGWFTNSVLPKRLGAARVRQLPPFGMDPMLVQFTADWLTQQISEMGTRVEHTLLVLAAHGSGRSSRPADVTRDFANNLARLLTLKGIHCGFVEEPPYIADSANNLGPGAICLPFFAARRGHVLEDLPEALDQAGFSGLRLEPLGCHPEIPRFIADSLAKAVNTAPNACET